MCTPEIFAAVAAISSVTGAVVGFTTQSQAAAAQRQYQQQVYEQTRTLAIGNLTQQFASITERQVEEQRKAAQEISQIVQQARQARASAYASSLEAGVSGLSVDALLDEYSRRESLFIQRTQQQERAVLSQLSNEAMGLSYQATGAVVGKTPQPVSGPSPLALAANVAGAAFSYFGDEGNFEFLFGGGGGGGGASSAIQQSVTGTGSMFGSGSSGYFG